MLTRVAALPGVSGVALASHLPLAALGKLRFDAPDGPFTPDKPLLAGIDSVTSEYFGVLGIPIVEGRTFSDRDVDGRPAVAILNQSAARQLFGGRAAIGRVIRMFGAKVLTVVGVVRDARYASVLESGVPMVYLSAWQDLPTGGVSVVVRTSQPRAMVAPLRDTVQRVDPHVALYDARVVSEQVDAALAPQRFGTVLLSFLAFIALTVAAVGIYSVVGCTLAERTSELGIRVALGASPRDVLRVVLRRTGAAIAAGTILGMAVAVPVSSGMARFLVGISPVDGWSFLAAVSLIACAAVAAVAAPARRAIRTDPLLALRAD